MTRRQRITYQHAFDLTATCRAQSRSMGWDFRDGVERAAALAVVDEARDAEGVIRVIKRVLNRYQIHTPHGVPQ